MSRIEDFITDVDVEDNYFFCHATLLDQEIVKSIFNTGLNFNETIFSTTCIYTGTKNDVISKIKNHYFNVMGYNIVIKIPKWLFSGFYGKLKNVFDAIAIQRDEVLKTIPNIFIYGCYDPENSDFLLNPNYHQILNLEDKKMIRDNILKYLEIRKNSLIVQDYQFKKEELDTILNISQKDNNNSFNVVEYRRNFVIKNLISIYNDCENDIMKTDYDMNYEIDKNFIYESVKNKKVNMNTKSLSEIYMNGKISYGDVFEWTLPAIIRMSQLLKCANELSNVNNFDYLGEFVSLQPIHTIIGEMINSKESIRQFKELKDLPFCKNIIK